MILQNYPGFVLSGVLFVILCLYVFHARRFRAETERTIRFLQASLESAREQLRRLRK